MVYLKLCLRRTRRAMQALSNQEISNRCSHPDADSSNIYFLKKHKTETKVRQNAFLHGLHRLF